MRNRELIYESYGYTFESQGFSKVWSHSKKGFILMSAFQSDTSMHKNLLRHDALKSNLRSYGLGFWEVDGIYKFDDGTIENELSVFIPYNDKKYTEDEFFNIGVKLGSKYGQESILYHTPKNGAYLIYANKKEKIGNTIDYKTANKFYSKLKKGAHKGRSFSFIFEGIRIPQNYISALGMEYEGSKF